MNDKILYVDNTEDFNKLLDESESRPVLVDFWAEWCGPCRIMNPIFDHIANTREDVLIAKVNVDNAREVASLYGIQAIPTMVNIKNREEIGNRIVGATPKEFLEKHLNDLVK